MVLSRRATGTIGGVLIGALIAGTPQIGFANDSSKGSNGSNDSSKSSGEGSKSSGDSSQNSGQGSRDSSQSSPKGSTQGTSDESTNSKGGAAVSVALVLVVVGASIVGGVFASRGTTRREVRLQTQALMHFLQRNHALVARDVAMADGPLLGSWSKSLGLDERERQRLGEALDGSVEQSTMLAALDGPMSEARAQAFASSFTQLGRKALGPDRFRAIALAAVR
jgi:hypothetical protein